MLYKIPKKQLKKLKLSKRIYTYYISFERRSRNRRKIFLCFISIGYPLAMMMGRKILMRFSYSDCLLVSKGLLESKGLLKSKC